MSRPEVMSLALARLREGVLTIDSAGRIWRHSRGGRRISPVRAENVGGKGYLRISLQMDDKRVRCVMAHRLVWTYLKGAIPGGLQINHKDLDKKNNRLSNLEVVTPSGNIRHSYSNGRPKPHSKANLSPTKIARVELIRSLRNQGKTISEVSSIVGMSKTRVHKLSGTKRPTARFASETIEEAIRMVRDGKTQLEACAATGISRTHLQRHLRRTV